MTFPPSNQEFLNKDTFKCVKCGECCRPVVKVNEEEIQRIEETGKKREDFIVLDPVTEDPSIKTLKQVNGVCMFLKREGDKFVCSIYNNRPNTCRKYPFTDEGKLKDCRPVGWERWVPIGKIL
jgi:Fe-S-cluster containining protein